MKNCASKLLIWRQKWTTGIRHGTSLVVRRVSSGRPIVVLFWTKYAFPRQIKSRILKLTTSKGHSNLLTVLSFVNCEEKGYYRVVLVGQLILDCRSYCGRSCCMQGLLLLLLSLPLPLPSPSPSPSLSLSSLSLSLSLLTKKTSKRTIKSPPFVEFCSSLLQIRSVLQTPD